MIYVFCFLFAWFVATGFVDLATNGSYPFPGFLNRKWFKRKYAIYLMLLAPFAIILGPRRAKHWLITRLWGGYSKRR
jgi:hypothetical protein